MKIHNLIRTVGCLAILSSTPGCKDKKLAVAQVSEAALRADMPRALDATNRLTSGMVSTVQSATAAVARPMAANEPGNLRAELVSLTTPGGPFTLYSFSFVVAIDREGRVVARDRANESDDRMKGMLLRPLFNCVAKALEDHGELCVGELPAEGETPSRVVLMATAPLHDAQNQVVGALAAGITFGQLTRLIDAATRTGVGDAVFWTGLHSGGRVFPSGRDRDVVARWLVPDILVRRVPATIASTTYLHYVEDGRGWGAAYAPLPTIANTELVLFRSEARQN